MDNVLYFFDLDMEEASSIEVRDIKLIEAHDGIIHIVNMDELVFRCKVIW